MELMIFVVIIGILMANTANFLPHSESYIVNVGAAPKGKTWPGSV